MVKNKMRKLISISIITFTLSLSINSDLNTCGTESVKIDMLQNLIKESMQKNYLQKSVSAESNELNEEIRITVQLKDSPAIDIIKNINEEKKVEDDIKSSQKDVIKKVEDITQNKVIKTFAYLANGFTIQGKRSDLQEISKIPQVKSCEESVLNNENVSKAEELIKAVDAWNDYGLHGEGTVISIIDTGIDYNHQDMKNINEDNIKLTEEKANDVISKIGRGKYISEKIPFAYNYADGDCNLINTFNDHGMHVTGIAAANGEVKGVANEAQILAMKVSSSFEGGFYNEDVLLALEDSVKLGADVVNMSFGSDSAVRGDESLYKSAIENASRAGVLCINAAGNSQTSVSTSTKTSPVNNLGVKDTSLVDNSSEYTLTVGSMKKNGDMSLFSSWGPSADLELKPEIIAPGESICSTINNNEYATYSGTSMASPSVSGGEAIIMQSIKKRYRDISGYELVSFAKNTAMNTAKPIYNDQYIYSPREQGAGLIQVNKAIENDVLVTDERGKASLALKSIGNTTTFKMHLKNYSNKKVAYNISCDSLYTEKDIKNEEIREVPIEGAEITFDKNEIAVNENGTEEVTGTIKLPQDLNRQNFVEGYITLKSNTENEPDLSIPLLAFYGEWGDEAILDAPLYEQTSITKTTGLGKKINGKFNYYGSYIDEQTGEQKIDVNNIAFSPNNDSIKDDVSLITYFLRNSKCYNIQILDANKNSLGNEMSYYNTTKSIYYDKIENQKKRTQYYYNWDGSIYSMKTGKYENVEDGKYYIRAKNISYTDGAKEQVTDMPITVDTKPPTVKNVEVNTFKFSNEVSYQIQWEAQDEGSAILKYATVVLNDDTSKEPVELSDIQEIDGVYSAMIDLKVGALNKITLAVMDNAGNIKTIDTYYDAAKDGQLEDDNKIYEPITFARLKNNSYVNVGAGKYKIKGLVRDDVNEVIINGSNIPIEEGEKERAIETSITLKEGENTVSVRARGKTGESIFEENYKVYWDRKQPVISSMSPVDEEKIYSTEDEKLSLSVEGTDESSMVCRVENLTNDDNFSKELDENGCALVDIPLENGLNELDVEIVDKAQNISETKKIYIVKVEDKNELNVGFINIDNSDYKVSSSTEDDYLEVKGYVTKIPKELKINNEDVKINDDFTFSKMVKLNEGLNKVKIYAVDDNDNIVEQYAYRLYYDKEAPVINLDLNCTLNDDGMFYTDNKNFTMKGAVSDKNSDYKLFLNGNMILNTDIGAVGDENLLKRSFDVPFTLLEGENNFEFRTVDKFGNDQLQGIKVVYTPGKNAETGEDDKFIIFAILFLTSIYYFSRKKMSKVIYSKK